LFQSRRLLLALLFGLIYNSIVFGSALIAAIILPHREIVGCGVVGFGLGAAIEGAAAAARYRLNDGAHCSAPLRFDPTA